MLRRTVALVATLGLLVGVGQGIASASPGRGSDPSPGGSQTDAELVTPVLSARRLPGLLAAHQADAQFSAAIAPILAQANPTSCLVVKADGRTIYDRNGATPLAGASTQKLLTATALLDHLPANYTFTTRAVAVAPPTNGVINGDLFVVGDGDPLLETTGYQPSQLDPNEPFNDFAKLADAIKAAGVTTVNGNVVGDESEFDAQRYVPSWPNHYITEGDTGPLSALMVNGGFDGLTDHPETPSANRQPGDPPVLAAATLITLLRERGVRVVGGAATATAPAGAHTVATLASLPLSTILGEMLRRSDNTTAEVLNKVLGAKVGGAGTSTAGAKVVASTLTKLGLPTKGLAIVDGSGLDLGDRMTCDLLTAVLDHNGPDSGIAHDLPVAGQSGTLRARLNGSPADGKVLAKTGTLDSVTALAGFAHAASGQTLTFAFLLNGPQPGTCNCALMDQMAIALAQYGSGVSLRRLGPQPTGS
jgi:serine-type D-Ala-D-Ala carboxypeptidase/endopeptidase (penicillin-binding protein 4)